MRTPGDAVLGIVQRQRGTEAAILGRTEIGLLVDAACSALPLLDTPVLHAAAAAAWILDDSHAKGAS